MQFWVGVMVLATIIVTVILVVLFGEVPNLIQGAYTIRIEFPNAPGVTKDTPVRKSGILIGRVTDVRLKDEGGVIVTASIDGNQKVFRNESCRIASTLLGDASLHFFLTSDKPGEPVKEQDPPLKGLAAPDPLVMIGEMQANMATAINSVSRTSDELGKVVHRVGGLLEKNEDRIQNIITQADESLKVMRQALDNANDVIGDPQVRAELRKALSELPGLFNDTRQTVTKVRESFDLVEQNLKNVENFTRPLGQHGEALVNRIDGTLQNLDTLVSEFTKFSRSLNNPEGSLGKLVNDPELYQHVSQTVARLDEITRELRPIVSDARVFTDKIARHPESLGVRGALERKPGIK